MKEAQQEKPWPRDPVTGVIRGAEPFDFGEGPGAMLFLHGWTSTPRELRFLAERVAPLGFHCVGPLLKGHGTRLEDLSPTRFSDYLMQAREAFDALAARHTQVTLCGLSMGGLLGLYLALERPVAGLILVAPFLRPWGRTMGLPNRWLVGRVPLSGNVRKFKPGPIREPRAAEVHLAYHAMPASAMVSVVEAGRRIQPQLARIACPTLILHSTTDTTSDFPGSKILIEKLGGEDKTLAAFNKGNHILTLDYEKEAVEETVVDWLRRRLSE